MEWTRRRNRRRHLERDRTLSRAGCAGLYVPIQPADLVGQSGTITMQGESQFTVTSDPNIYDERGTWHITSGTGLYTGIGGEGTTSATLDFTAPQTTLLLQGNVTQ